MSTHLHSEDASKHRITVANCGAYSTSVGLGESSPLEPEDNFVESEALDSHELKTLFIDAERARLVKKLSEENQQNRYLKRQIRMQEDVLIDFKSELAGTELEIQALVSLAREIRKGRIPEGSRKINGKCIQSHLVSRLEALYQKIKEQLKDVTLYWCGMAESVQVMGSLDGWSQGEHLSPEYTSSFTKFTATLMLRPDYIWYEIKFLVDGEWHLSPEYPTVGEGLIENNLLIVE